MEHCQLLGIERTLQAAMRCVGLAHVVNSGAVLVFALTQADTERAIRVVAEGQAHSGWIAIAIIPPYRYGGNAGRGQPQGARGVSDVPPMCLPAINRWTLNKRSNRIWFSRRRGRDTSDGLGIALV